MNKNNIGLLALLVVVFGFSACNDAVLQPINNVAYITQADDARKTDWRILWADSLGVSKQLELRLGQASEEDVKFTISVDEAYLKQYAEAVGKTYALPPVAHFDFPSEVNIKAGSTSATINVTYTAKLDDESEFRPSTSDVEYAIPIKVTASAGIEMSERSSHYVYVLSFQAAPKRPAGPHKQWVPTFANASGAFMTTKDFPAEMQLFPQLTMEWWGKSSGFSRNNQALFQNGHPEFDPQEMYIRYGDVQPTPYSYLQLKLKGGTGTFRTEPNQLTANEWYHYTLTYEVDKEEIGTWHLYIDPLKPTKLVFPMHLTEVSGGAASIRKLTIFPGGWVDQYSMCQFRLWKKALTRDEMLESMYYPVDPEDPDLVMYLPMDEGLNDSGDPENTRNETKFLNDVTGNGFDMNMKTTAAKWEMVEFKDPNSSEAEVE